RYVHASRHEVPVEIARRAGRSVYREQGVVDVERHDGVVDEVGRDGVDTALDVPLRGGGGAAGADLLRPGATERRAGRGERGVTHAPVGIPLEVPHVDALRGEDAVAVERRGAQERTPAARVGGAAEVETGVDRGQDATDRRVDQAP